MTREATPSLSLAGSTGGAPTSRADLSRQRQRKQTSDAILKTALSEIAEHGLSGIQIEQIARKAGVTRPTVYAHFPQREDFLRALQARTEASALEMLKVRVGNTAGVALIHALVDALFDMLEAANGTLRRESFALMLREPRPEQWWANSLFTFLSDALSEAQKTRALPSDLPPEALVRVVMTSLFGFLVIEGDNPDLRRQDAHHMLDRLIGPDEK